MKKMMLVAIGIYFAMAGFAQFSFGVQATGNLSSAGIKSVLNIGFNKTMRVLPGAGIVAQYDLSDKLAIRSGVNYLQHGVKLKATLDPTGIKLNNGVFANAGYQLGLADISEGAGKYKNHGLQLSVGYLF